MEQPTENEIFRFDDRREYNGGPPDGLEERRISYRRENDQYRTDVKTVLDMEMEETGTEEELNIRLEPILEKIKACKY